MKYFLKGVLFVLMIILVSGCGNENDEATPVEVAEELFELTMKKRVQDLAEVEHLLTEEMLKQMREQIERMESSKEDEEYWEGGWHLDEDIYEKALEIQTEVIETKAIDYEIENDTARVKMEIKQPKWGEYIDRLEDMSTCEDSYKRLRENKEEVIREVLAKASMVTVESYVELHREEGEWKIYSIDAQNN